MNKAKMNSIKEKFPNVMAIFPLPIYKTNIAREFTKEEQDELDVIISEQLTVIASSGIQGDQTTTKNLSIDKYLLNRKSFLSIQSFIKLHLKEFATSVIGIDTVKASWLPHITKSWLNVYKPNNYDPLHRHYKCIISGVFYINCLKLSDKPDGIIFDAPSHHILQQFELPIAQDTKFSDKPQFVPVVGGDLILFPSNVKHGVNLNETSDQTRISLSFDSI